MDKESKEMLKELNEVLGDLLNDNQSLLLASSVPTVCLIISHIAFGVFNFSSTVFSKPAKVISIAKSYTEFYQSYGRCYRIGQTKKVTAYKFVTDKTIESDIYTALDRKQDFNNCLV